MENIEATGGDRDIYSMGVLGVGPNMEETKAELLGTKQKNIIDTSLAPGYNNTTLILNMKNYCPDVW